jgi:hypothetical protein
MKLITTAIMVLLPTLALAQPLPVPRPQGPGGSCGHGYTTSGSFCVPSAGAQDAVPKPPGGSCGHGWTASGSYCLRSGSGRR